MKRNVFTRYGMWGNGMNTIWYWWWWRNKWHWHKSNFKLVRLKLNTTEHIRTVTLNTDLKVFDLPATTRTVSMVSIFTSIYTVLLSTFTWCFKEIHNYCYLLCYIIIYNHFKDNFNKTSGVFNHDQNTKFHFNSIIKTRLTLIVLLVEKALTMQYWKENQ